VGFLSEIHALKIDLYLHQQGLDTTTPAGKAMFQMMGVFAEFERAVFRNVYGLACAAPRQRASLGTSAHRQRDRGGYPQGSGGRYGDLSELRANMVSARPSRKGSARA
jgi:DNA invertase Pin-like site-specific DNA recombinase